MQISKTIFSLMILMLCAVGISGCVTELNSNVPSDFSLTLDAYSARQQQKNVNIQIDAQGKGHYEIYNNGGVIRMDEDSKVVYERSQVTESGNFQLSAKQADDLWGTINKNYFFQLTDDYRMQIGLSYAFIQVEANGQIHQVDNIGMEVPEIRAIVEIVNSMLPSEASIVYRDGQMP